MILDAIACRNRPLPHVASSWTAKSNRAPVIRRYSAADSGAVLSLLSFLPDYYPGGGAWLERRLLDIHCGRALATVVTIHTGVAGILIEKDKGARSTKICTLYVRHDCRRYGLGRALIAARMIDWLRASKEEVYLTARECVADGIARTTCSFGFYEVARIWERYRKNEYELVYRIDLQKNQWAISL